MTRKEYELLAKVLVRSMKYARLTDKQMEELIYKFAEQLANNRNSFQKEKFIHQISKKLHFSLA